MVGATHWVVVVVGVVGVGVVGGGRWWCRGEVGYSANRLLSLAFPTRLRRCKPESINRDRAQWNPRMPHHRGLLFPMSPACAPIMQVATHGEIYV